MDKLAWEITKADNRRARVMEILRECKETCMEEKTIFFERRGTHVYICKSHGIIVKNIIEEGKK